MKLRERKERLQLLGAQPSPATGKGKEDLGSPAGEGDSVWAWTLPGLLFDTQMRFYMAVKSPA